MEKQIKSVEKGWGETSIFFTTNAKCINANFKVDNIQEESKQTAPDYIFNVYRGYKDGKLVFEMGVTIDVTVYYV